MTFSNQQIYMDDLPTIEDLKYEPLDPRYKVVSTIVVTIIFVIIAAIYFGLGFVIERLWALPLILIFIIICVFLGGVWIALIYKSFKYTGYALREKDIVYTSGILFRHTAIVPFNRIQHCELSQGPLDRMYGLASLSMNTAGQSEIELDGITYDKAIKLKNYLTQKIAMDEEE
jgi:uncharacterized protein